ncbi:MAG: type II toxin-antitoxin system PemK/MazF family toxin [Ardenticatenaceae bacterium]
MKELIYSNASTKVRTTVDLPSTVERRIEQAVDQGIAKSQNALIVQAVEHYLDEMEQAWIDEQFIAMAQDKEYQALQQTIMDEFAYADWESWDLTDMVYDEEESKRIKRGEIYWLRLDAPQRSEQVTVRPAVVVSSDEINRYSSVVVICPLASTLNLKRHYPNDVPIYAPEGGLAEDSVIFTGQMRSISKSRVGKRLGHLAPDTHQRLNRALKTMLGL